jgi:hypothetical protein
MAKRAPGYRPKRLFAVKSLATKGMTDNSTPSVLVNARLVPECLVRRFFADLNRQKQFFTDSGGAPCVQKKTGSCGSLFLWKGFSYFFSEAP